MSGLTSFVEEFISAWNDDTELQGEMSLHASIGLSEQELEQFLYDSTWPESRVPMCRGIGVLIQPALVRGDSMLWYDRTYSDVNGKEVAVIRGTLEFIQNVVLELTAREFSHEIAEHNKETQEQWQSKYLN